MGATSGLPSKLILYGKRKFSIGLCSSIFVWLILICLSATIHGQSGRARPETSPVTLQEGGETPDEDDVLRVRTDEVMIPVSVRDSVGLPVNGLTAESFFIYDNGQRQEITSLNRRRVPANIVLLLDASGSVFSSMRFIREAAKGFLEGLLPEDRVCVMQFADSVELLQDWTAGTDSQQIEKALTWRYHPGQRTTFYDGLYLAAQEQLNKVEGRRIVILLTDGIDSAEKRRASYQDAMNAVRRAEASVYVLSLTGMLLADLEKYEGSGWKRIFGGYDPKEISRYKKMIEGAEEKLSLLASETGGRIFFPKKEFDLAPAYRSIAEELRQQYIITYSPKRRPLAGEYRNVRVLVAPGGYEVTARSGYMGRL